VKTLFQATHGMTERGSRDTQASCCPREIAFFGNYRKGGKVP
jgi:hypothetical protein